MKSRVAGIISGTAIAMGVTVAGFSLVGTAHAKSTNALASMSQSVVVHGDHGRPDLSNLAIVLGLSTSELQTQLRSGKTLAEIAAAQSVDVANVIDAIVADAKSKLAAEVSSGDLTQAEADSRLAEITTKVTDMVNNGRPEGRMGFGSQGHHGRPDLSNLATVLGLSTSELQTQLQSGKTLAEIAAAQSVDVANVIDAIVADAKSKLAAAVSSGDLTQAEADSRLAEITTRVTDMVNNGRPEGRKGLGHRGNFESRSFAQES
ncbi:MAG: hypothetical protein ABI570_03740, partial [Ilumatobacteraceae bacterium]